MTEGRRASAIVVLDINGTLLKRIHRREASAHRTTEEKAQAHKIKDHLVYARPHLQLLSSFLESSGTDYVFWSTMHGHNLRLYVEHLRAFGFSKYLACYDQSSCTECSRATGARTKKSVKDLNVIAAAHDVSVDSCVLVDDDPYKAVVGQNFIHVREYDPGRQDDVLLHLIETLKEFVYGIPCS